MNIEQEINLIVCNELNLSKHELTLDTKLLDVGDSLDQMEVIMRIEERFGILISDENVDKLQTLRDINNYVNERLNSTK